MAAAKWTVWVEARQPDGSVERVEIGAIERDLSSPGPDDLGLRLTDRIIADLEQGVRPWLKPWSAEHAEGRITRPLRHNGIPYKGINVLMLWSAAAAKCARDHWRDLSALRREHGGGEQTGPPPSYGG